uniref:FXYD domain-containing ion transport regulator n=1 Tax=Cynoglossus semilaevis TaxID=244447 RepID=A0A3P8WKV0_CYNSE
METILLFFSSLLVCVSDTCVCVFTSLCFFLVILDYESLRIGGLAFAVVLFTLGILLILSDAPGDEEAQEETLIVTKGRVLFSSCCHEFS